MQPEAIESGGAPDEAPEASAPVETAARSPELEAVIALRKRVSVLESLQECLA